MDRLILRPIEQRTTMLSGVSHDLRTILTRFKLELALLGDTPDLLHAAVNRALLDRGLFTMVRFNGIMTNPPLCITEEQLRESFAIIDRSLEVTDRVLG